MGTFNLVDLSQKFADNDACIEWLKNQLYPDGIKCPVCQMVTKHHKVAKRPCYICSHCGNQVYPAVGTIFQKSTTPLTVWFDIINRIYNSDHKLTARDIEREYSVTYKTAWRISHKVKGLIQENRSTLASQTKKISVDSAKNGGSNQSENHGVAVATEKSGNDKSNLLSLSYPSKTGSLLKGTSKRNHQKKDRTARLLRLQILLSQHPEGLKLEEIASKCSISIRTAYRDLETLESELEVPIWQDGSRRGIAEGHFLPPINFTLSEASVVFLAARLIQKFSYLPTSSLVTTFMKLNTIVPAPLRKQVQNIVEHIENQPKNELRIRKFNNLMQAYLSQHRVRIRYQFIDEDKTVEHLIDPYFIEASIIGGSIYVIAFCHDLRRICSFRLERIMGEVIIEPETFKIPADFNIIDYMGTAWGIRFDEKTETVKLRFKPKMRERVQEIYLHPSQSLEVQSDGSTIMTLKVRDSFNFLIWVIGWFDQVEILEPPLLRNQIKNLIKSVDDIYN